ncbi:MAG: dipeptide epimerase [Burkholderiales bacterium]
MQVRIERLPFRLPFRISGYTFTESPAVFVTLRQDGFEGRGEAAGVYFLDDTPERMAGILESLRARVESGVSREELQRILPIGGARNAVDCALWELDARRAGRPVWRLAGLDRVTPLVTTFTLGAEAPEAMAEGAVRLAGARALKLKLSGDPALDAERVKAVRAARPEVWLGVDANQGFSIESFAGLIPVLTQARVQLIEQPLARGRESDLDGFDCPIELAADESVLGIADIAPLVGRFDVLNIKLDKCGGLTEALSMALEARRLGLKVMVGNMVGTSLAMAPAFVLGQLCDYVDLDGPTFLADDPPPAVRYENGTIWCGPEVWGGA